MAVCQGCLDVIKQPSPSSPLLERKEGEEEIIIPKDSIFCESCFISKKAMECIQRSKLELKPYQKKIVYHMSSKNNRSLLVVHPTGFGKTLTAATYSQCFLDTYPGSKVIFIGPSALKENFRKGLITYGLSKKEIEESYLFFSFQKFQNDSNQFIREGKCRGNLFIIDEVHELRNMNLNSEKSGKRAKAVLSCLYQAKKFLLLTATPFVNSLNDLISLTNLVHGTPVITKKSQIKDLSNFKPLLRGYVDYIKPIYDDNFPKKIVHTVKIKMPPDYEEAYCKLIKGFEINESVFSSPQAFYNAHRRAVNKIGNGKKYFSLKMDQVLHIIGDKKTLIYSNWLEFGLDPISDSLEEAEISFEGFSGRIKEIEKKEIIERFNQDEFQVLIISPSGKLGIDLVGVRNVIVMDPVWNPSGMLQIEGRAIRYGSHSHLPKKERVVDVYHLVLETSTPPPNVGGVSQGATNCLSGDVLVYNFIEKKMVLDKQVMKMLEEISI